jgi:hypothetical protein
VIQLFYLEVHAKRAETLVRRGLHPIWRYYDGVGLSYYANDGPFTLDQAEKAKRGYNGLKTRIVPVDTS